MHIRNLWVSQIKQMQICLSWVIKGPSNCKNIIACLHWIPFTTLSATDSHSAARCAQQVSTADWSQCFWLLSGYQQQEADPEWLISYAPGLSHLGINVQDALSNALHCSKLHVSSARDPFKHIDFGCCWSAHYCSKHRVFKLAIDHRDDLCHAVSCHSVRSALE